MSNPFVYGKIVEGKNFCNRTVEIKELKSAMLSSQNVVLYSQRRFGKTSLIKRVFSLLHKENVHVIYIDLYQTLTTKDVTEKILGAISNSLEGTVEGKIREISNLFKKIRPTVAFDSKTGDMSFSFDLKDSFISNLEHALDAISNLSKKGKRKVCVCFDEFQEIVTIDNGLIEKVMRSRMQHHKDVAYIFMGSKKHILMDMFENPNKPFYKSVMPYPLNKISTLHLVQFIKTRFGNKKITISDEQAEIIVHITKNHPHYVQFLASAIYDILAEKKKITANVILEGLQDTMNKSKPQYEMLWDNLTLQQKKALVAIAMKNVDEKPYSASFLKKHGIAQSSFKRSIDTLIDKDIIDKAGSHIEIMDIFLRHWIRLSHGIPLEAFLH